jgi:hypothetical protein
MGTQITKTVRVDSVVTQIRTQHLPNTNLVRYPYANLFLPLSQNLCQSSPALEKQRRSIFSTETLLRALAKHSA